MLRSFVLLSSVSALACAPVFAQESRLLFDAPQVQLPDDSPPFQRLGDFDGDGRMDAVGSRVNSNGTQYEVRVWQNVQGVFTQRYNDLNSVTSGYGDRMAIAVGDVDGDGDQDFVVGGGWQLYLYTNQGNFTFTRSLLASTTDTISDVALGDIDGDGRLDVIWLTVQAGGFGAVHVRFANGAQTSAGTIGLGAYPRLEICDLDGDPQPEIGVWSGDTRSFRIFDWANGALTNTSLLVPPFLQPGHNVYWSSGDIDGDGDIDVVCSELPNTDLGIGAMHVMRRTGPTTFVGEPPYPLGPVEFLIDVDGDGLVDGVCCGSGGGPPTPTWPQLNFISYTRISPNHGGVLGPTIVIPNKGSRQLAGIADVDGDGDKDLVAGACVWFARGSLTADRPSWPTGMPSAEPMASLRSDLLDHDRDGDVDIFLGTTSIGTNDGSGGFSWHGVTLPLAQGEIAGHPICRGDFDGDGAPDLLVPVLQASTQQFTAMRLLRNNGSGVFVDAGVASTQRIGWLSTPLVDDHTAFVVADVDGDGDLDVIAISRPGDLPHRSELWLNQGNGTFVAGPVLLNERIELVADFDGDHIPDIVTRMNNGTLQLRCGTGVPNAPFPFTAPTIIPVQPIPYPGSVVLVDADDDGRPDVLVLGVAISSGQATVSIHRNTTRAPGAPTFAPPIWFDTIGVDAINVLGCASVADFDGDGRSDVAISNAVSPVVRGQATRFYLRISANGGPLGYAPPVDQAVWQGIPVDIDGDGDLDMVGPWVWKNVHWHGPTAGSRLQYGTGTAGEFGVTPLLGLTGPVRAGGAIELRLQGVTGPTVSVLALSVAPADLPDFGLPGLHLLIDPAALNSVLWFLPQPGLGTASGAARVTLALPSGLTNVDFCEQVIVLDPATPAGVAASNGLTEHIGG